MSRSSGRSGLVRALLPVLLAGAVAVGTVRCLLDCYFTTHRAQIEAPAGAPWPRMAQRVAIVLVDALRYADAFDPAYFPRLAARRSDSAWGKAVAGPITMSVPGIRLLSAGVTSDFLEIFENWNPRATTVPSLFSLARRAGLRSLSADDTYLRLFPDGFDGKIDPGLRGMEYYVDPPHRPDLACIAAIRRVLDAGDPFDVVVVPIVGPDHASHRWRTDSARFREYARWLDPHLDELISALRAVGATVLVTSDHGMSARGQHGGNEAITRTTPYLLEGPGVRPGHGPDLDQADLPATLAVLLGLPLPPAGEGDVARAVLDLTSDQALTVTAANVVQLERYLDAYRRQVGPVLVSAPPDVGAIASARGAQAAFEAADRWIAAAREALRTSGDRPTVIWVWMACLAAIASLLIAPVPRPGVPATAAAGMALLLAAASWVWPAANGAAGFACLATAVVHGVRGGRQALLTRVGAFLVLAAAAAAGYFGFVAQFRSETVFGSFSSATYRLAGYLISAPLAWVAWSFGRAQPGGGSRFPAALWLPVLAVVVFPEGQPLLRIAPGLTLGLLWAVRAAAWPAGGRIGDFLAAEWRLSFASVVWVLADAVLDPLLGRVDFGSAPWADVAVHLPAAALAVLYAAVRVRRATVRDRVLLVATALGTLPALVLSPWREACADVAGLCALGALALSRGLQDRRSAMWMTGVAVLSAMSLLTSPHEWILVALFGASFWAFVLAAPDAPGVPPGGGDVLLLAGAALFCADLAIHLHAGGSFSFSDYEVSVAFLGNPTHELWRSALQLLARFLLPLVLLWTPIVGGGRLPGRPWRSLAALYAVTFLHLGWLMLGLVAASGQFYTPYRLAGETVFFVAIVLVQAPVVLLLHVGQGVRTMFARPVAAERS